ncbi:MAG TPA: radical SAM family heme chaperone HemW [Sphingobacteriaceae bacterium]
MAGIYLHIPFCKKACFYCDFHFTTSFKYKTEVLEAMHREVEFRKDYLSGARVDTIYFGGGTPSVLEAAEIRSLLDHLTSVFPVAETAEITLEANPDDLHKEKVKELRQTPINRFSIGTQSFFNDDLKWMNRAHTADEAESAIKRVQDAGFENITIDLIYGYPLLSDQKWQFNISKAISLEVPHISSYSMTVEPRTALASFINKGKQPPLNDHQSAGQFVSLIESLSEAGFEHYEISNFAKPGRHSQHNSNYWKGIGYLGIGPSAHSFNSESRQWNVASNARYLEALAKNTIPAEMEILSTADRVNEYIMTSLRTMWGLDLSKVDADFGYACRTGIERSVREFIEKGHVVENAGILTLSSEGKLFADHIASQLFIDPDQI